MKNHTELLLATPSMCQSRDLLIHVSNIIARNFYHCNVKSHISWVLYINYFLQLRSLSCTITSRQAKRHEGIVAIILEGAVEGHQKMGRQIKGFPIGVI